MTPSNLVYGAVAFGLSMSLATPLIYPMAAGIRGTPLLLVIVAAVLLGVASFSGYDSNHPRRNTLMYILDHDAKEAVWASTDTKVDSWTSLFLGDDPTREPLHALYPFFPREGFVAEAPVADLRPPSITVLTDARGPEGGVLSLLIRSERGAPTLDVYLDQGTELIASSVNGQRVTGQWDSQWYFGIRYYGVGSDGIILDLTLTSDRKIGVSVVDQSYQLVPESLEGFPDRPRHMMPEPVPDYHTDSTFVRASFRI